VFIYQHDVREGNSLHDNKKKGLLKRKRIFALKQFSSNFAPLKIRMIQ
jgi:hypothetical protein